MMAGMNIILGNANADPTILVGSFGIYYKIQQIALFSCFGLSNTIITILSFNYGMKNKDRSIECIKYGIIDTIIVSLIITILFEIIARPLAQLFSLSGGSTVELIDVCEKATRIASIGYIFMGISIAIQGVFQALRYGLKPFMTALLRLVIFVFPIAFLFTLSENVVDLVWWTFPIAEFLTAIISIFMLKGVIKNKVNKITFTKKDNNNLIITISRQHGTGAKRIAKLLARKLNIKFYDKELTMLEAKKRGLDKQYIDSTESDEDGYSVYLSLDANKEAINAQSEIITKLAEEESFVIVGRSADYILRNHNKLVTIFLYANEEFRIQKIMKMYNDTREDAIKNINKSDETRSNYYTLIANKQWGLKENYDLYIDASLDDSEIVNIIENFIRNN